MKNSLNRKQLLVVLLCVIGVLPCMATAIPAITASGSKGNVIAEHALTVSYADLDLSKPAGAESLYDRLKIASSRACNALLQDFRIPGMHRLSRQCYTETLANAVHGVDSSLLRDLHANTR